MTDQPPGSKNWTTEEWTTHVLNIHGAIFERWVAEVVRKSDSWALAATEYPVEYPPPEGAARGYESALDLLAEFSPPDNDNDLVALIECKKNNPSFVDWVFFEANLHTPRIPRLWVNQIRSTKEAGEVRPSPKLNLYGFDPIGRVADHASETRGSYDDPTSRKNTKTSAQAINDACHQVAIATQAIVHEKYDKLKTEYQRSNDWRPKKELLTFVPVIVTTARLYILQFDPSIIQSLAISSSPVAICHGIIA